MMLNYPLSSVLCLMILYGPMFPRESRATSRVMLLTQNDPDNATIAATSTEPAPNPTKPLKFDKFQVTKTSACTDPSRTSIVGKDSYSMAVHIRNYTPAKLLGNQPLFVVLQMSKSRMKDKAIKPNMELSEKCKIYYLKSCDGPSSMFRHARCWCRKEGSGVTFYANSTIEFTLAYYGFEIMDPDFLGVKRETPLRKLIAQKACPKNVVMKAKSKMGAGAKVVASLFAILPACIIVASF